MKKTIILIMAALALASCNKSYNNNPNDIVGGASYKSSSAARNYLMSIADGLVTDALGELESAFWVQGVSQGESTHFDTRQGSILDENVTWRVKGGDRALYGMTLKNIGSETWELSYQGSYTLRGESYPVSFILKAKRGAVIKNDHYNWAVTLNGNRTERKGYACSFKTNATVLYMCSGNNTTGWNYLDGSFMLTVIKNDKDIDLWVMEFDGSPSSAEFRMGL